MGNKDSDFEEFDYEDEEETLDVYDAALIYFSKGFDEDYQFGYTHEELVDAMDEE